MKRSALYEAINDTARYADLPPVSPEEFVVTLSALEAKGIILTDGDEIHVLYTYDGGKI